MFRVAEYGLLKFKGCKYRNKDLSKQFLDPKVEFEIHYQCWPQCLAGAAEHNAQGCFSLHGEIT